MNGGALATVNGTFFNFGYKTDVFKSKDLDNRIPSFPATPGITTWNDSANTRTLCIKENNGKRYAVVDDTGYHQRNYSSACSFSITLLNPSVDKKKNDSIYRTYVGVSKDLTTVLFFVSQSKTQAEMENLMRRWKIPDYHFIMGDGSDSSALVTKKGVLGGNRSLPHMIKIYDK